MQGTIEQAHKKSVFGRLVSWWPSSKVRLWLVFLLGRGPLIFGASLPRALTEAVILDSLLFLLAADNVIVPDYRLIALSYLPGALLATGWATLRLRPLISPTSKGFTRVLLLIAVNIGVGLLLAALLVLDFLVVGSLFYSIQNLSAPALPDLFGTALNIFAPNQAANFLTWLISGPTTFKPATAPLLIVGLRLLFFVGEAALAFVVIRSVIGLLAMPSRLLKRLATRRLLWQLTLSHFGVVLASLASAIFFVVFIIVPVFSLGGNNQVRPARLLPAYEAKLVVNGLEAIGKDNQADAFKNLSLILQLFTDNSLNVNYNLTNFLQNNNLSNKTQQLLRDFRSISALPDLITLTNPQGGLIVTSNQTNYSQLLGEYQPDLQQLLNKAASGQIDLSQLVLEKVQPTLLIAGAYPFITAGKVQMIVLVISRPEVALTSSSRLLGTLLVTGVFLIVTGTIASFFAMFTALLFGYLMSKRLVRNLETLTVAADALASGNLEQRVSSTAQDEVGRLALRFNSMAQNLQENQASLAHEKEIAEQALQTKRELVANVSHELRTPVSTIRAHVDWLLSTAKNREYAAAVDGGFVPTEPDSDLYQYLDIIGRETERLSLLIDDLLDLARVEVSQTTMELQPVDVPTIVQEVRQSLGLMAQRERKIVLTLDLAPDLPLALADRTRLLQILLNLTRNAINYTPAGGIVSIGAANAEANQVAIWVADTGMGIAPEDLERVFERFYRSDASRSRHTGGAGLGLAIVKTLIEAMGGTITVESVLNEGSKFTVTLPIAP